MRVKACVHEGCARGACDSLGGHLGDELQGGEARVEEVVSVLSHLDGGQPLLHRAKAAEVWDRAVQERLGGAVRGGGMSKY